MENNEIKIEKNKLIETYKNGNECVKNTLKQLFGKEMFDLNIMDRVKTFEDAVKELGENHPLVKEYRRLDNPTTDHLAYMKIRIIVTALNEGWEPQFTDNEYRYYPYFCFYTKQEINEISKDELANVFVFDKPIGAYAGLAYTNFDCMFSIAYVGSRLCFKTKELAEYAGKQFIKLYANYYMN